MACKKTRRGASGKSSPPPRVQRSKFKVQRSKFNVQRSTFKVRHRRLPTIDRTTASRMARAGACSLLGWRPNFALQAARADGRGGPCHVRGRRLAKARSVCPRSEKRPGEGACPQRHQQPESPGAAAPALLARSERHPHWLGTREAVNSASLAFRSAKSGRPFGGAKNADWRAAKSAPLSPTPAARPHPAKQEWRGGEGLGVRERRLTYPDIPRCTQF